MLKYVFVVLSLLLPLTAAAEVVGYVPRSEVPNAQIIGGQSNRLITTDPSDLEITATGSSVARTLGDRAAEIFNVKDGWGGIAGAKVDAQYVTATVSITNGSRNLTTAESLFAATDVGKTIVVKGARTPSTVGEITAVAIDSAGSGYTSVPVASASGGGGAGFVGEVYMKVVSATVNAGGASCSNGSQTITLGAAGITQATLTVTVSGNTVVSVDSVSNGGLFDTIPVLTAVTSEGAGCVGATFDIVMGVDSISVVDGGTGYLVSGTTVSLTTAGSSVQAVVGTVTVAPDTTPLVTTISAYTSPTAVTLTDAASATVSAVSQPLLWGTDDTAAINATITAANAMPNGGVAYIPPGNTLINVSTSSTIIPKTNVTLQGGGLGVTNVICQDFSNTGQGCVSNWTGSPVRYQPITNVEFRDLTFVGMNQMSTLVSRPLFKVQNYAQVRLKSVGMNYARAVSALFVGGDSVYAENIHIFQSTAGGLSVQDTSSVVINGCIVRNSNDDAISAHTNNGWPTSVASIYATPYAFAYAGEAVRSGVTISNCDITESQGISVLGAKSLTVSNTTMRRIMARGLVFYPSCSSSTAQGCTPNFGVTINGLAIYDVFQRPEPSPKTRTKLYIQISGGPKGSSGILPTYGTNGGALYENNTGSSTTTPGGGYVNINGVTLMRTLPAVAAWADWNVGDSLWVGSNGGGVPYTGAVSETNMQSDGIAITGAVREVRISNCLINTSGLRAIRVTQSNLASLSQDGVDITNCRLSNFQNVALYVNSATAKYQRITLRNNVIDGDPMFTSANRGSNGTWARFTYPYGIYTRNLAGLVIENNHFRNVTAPNVNTSGLSFIRGNVVFAQAAATGFSTSNVGVGYIDANGPDWTTVEEDSNPNSATYGSMLSANYDNASAIPSTGCWVIGRVVANSAPSVASSGIVSGWKRLTTGCANVSGTDWVPMYTKTTWP